MDVAAESTSATSKVFCTIVVLVLPSSTVLPALLSIVGSSFDAAMLTE